MKQEKLIKTQNLDILFMNSIIKHKSPIIISSSFLKCIFSREEFRNGNYFGTPYINQKYVPRTLVITSAKDVKGLKLTGVDPSRETLALEKDKFPAKNEPPLWNTFWGLRTSAAHLCTDESVVATQMPSSCNANCKMGCSFVQSNTLSLVAKSVKYNCKCKKNQQGNNSYERIRYPERRWGVGLREPN